jgi:hypothetical protein
MGARDSQALYCSFCTPGGLYKADKVDVRKWEKVLQKAGLGLGAGYLVGDSRVSTQLSVWEGDKMSYKRLEEQRTINTEVPHRNNSIKVWPSMKPPAWVRVDDLLNRLDPTSREIVTLRVVQDMMWNQIVEKVGICQRQVITRWNAAIELMRRAEAAAYLTVGTCEQCGAEFPVKPKGMKRHFCMKCQNAKAKAKYRAKSIPAALRQIWPPIPLTIHPVQLYPPYTGF